jgi:hypothetical protein
MIQSISLLAIASTVAFAQPGMNHAQKNNIGFGQKQQQGFPFPYDPSKQFNNFPAFPFPYYPSYPDYQLYPPNQGGGGAMNSYAQKPMYDTRGAYGGAHGQYDVAFMQPQEQPYIPSLPNYPWETNYLFQYGYPFILKERLDGDDDKSPHNSQKDKSHPLY